MAQTSSKKRHIHSENTYRYLLLLALLLTVTTLIRFIAFRSTLFLKFVFTCSQISLFLIGKILHSQVKSGSDITDGFINKALLKYVYLTFAIYGGAWITDAAWRGYWIVSARIISQ